jgi:thiamine biosynthesis protein ThiS
LGCFHPGARRGVDCKRMKVVLNGKDRELPQPLNISGLLAFLGFGETPLLVEYNGTALLKSEWAEVWLNDEDRVELVKIVAGG